MGAGQSRPEADDKVFYPSETSIQFSQDVVNHLSDQLHASEVPPARQTTLDEQIRARIQNELAHLREEENSVREEIERALEKENLDKERALAGGSDEENGGAKSSTALMGDLEEVRQKVDRFKTRRDLTDFPEVKVKGEAVVSCFKANPTTSLDCWREVAEFKSVVSEVEKKYVDSLR